MAFDSLSEKLQNVFKNLRSKGRLTEDDVKAALKEVKMALLEADVNFKVVKGFIKDVQERAVGQDVMNGLNPGQMVIKIVNEELVKLMGSETTEIKLQPGSAITVIMMAGLQGAGKTTTTAKLAGKFKLKGKKPLLVACDVYRPAAIKQLEKISGSLENSVLSPEERAEILRFFSFRKVSIENMPVALKWVHIYYVITKINYLDLASFVVAVIKNTYVLDEGFSIDRIFDYIYSAMRDTPVSPQEFIDAFLKTKYILAATQNTILYFDTLKDFFATNQPYDKLEDYVQQKVVIE